MDAAQGALGLGVNFGLRQASPAQRGLASVIWGGTALLGLATIWSYAAQNVKLSAGWNCADCSADGYHPMGPTDCPIMCVNDRLKKQIATRCSKPPFMAVNASNLLPPHAMDLRQKGQKQMFRRLGDKKEEASTSIMHYLTSLEVLPVFLPLILVIAIVWFVLLHHAALVCIWCSMGLFECGVAYGYHLTGNWMMLVIMVALAVFMALSAKDLKKGAQCLEVSLGAVAKSPRAMLVMCANALMLLLYSALLMAMLVFTSQVYFANEDKETGHCDLLPESLNLTGFFQALFLLTANFFNMVGGFTVAYAIGCWYFHQSDSAAPPAPMVTGMELALLSWNGTGVCAQAAVVMSLVEYMEKKVKKSYCPCCDPLYCFVACLYTFFRQQLEALCSFGLVAVALDGGPLVETSRRAAATLGVDRMARFLVIDASLSWILRMQAVALSTVITLLVWATIDKSEDLGIFDGLVRSATEANSFTDGGQWVFVLTVFCFYWFVQRPLFSLSVVVLVNLTLADFITWPTINSALAAILVGSVASLVLHQLAETANMALVTMLYCYSLEEAVYGASGPPSERRSRKTVAALWEGSSALLMPSAPPQQAVQPAGSAEAREVQLTPPASVAMTASPDV